MYDQKAEYPERCVFDYVLRTCARGSNTSSNSQPTVQRNNSILQYTLTKCREKKRTRRYVKEEEKVEAEGEKREKIGNAL